MSEVQSRIDPFFLPSMLVVWVFPSNPDLNVSVTSGDQAKKERKSGFTCEFMSLVVSEGELVLTWPLEDSVILRRK